MTSEVKKKKSSISKVKISAKRKYRSIPNRINEAGEHNNWTKKSLDGLNSIHQEEERIREVEYRLLEIIQSEEKKKEEENK